jgi:hypothetical protein
LSVSKTTIPSPYPSGKSTEIGLKKAVDDGKNYAGTKTGAALAAATTAIATAPVKSWAVTSGIGVGDAATGGLVARAQGTNASVTIQNSAIIMDGAGKVFKEAEKAVVSTYKAVEKTVTNVANSVSNGIKNLTNSKFWNPFS